MLKYIGKRVLQMIALFYVFIFVLFSIMSAQPGGIENQFVGNPNIPPEAKLILIEQLGLDQPWHVQLGHTFLNYTPYPRSWTPDAAPFMGVSWSQFPRPVGEIIGVALPRTAFLFLIAVLVAYVLGFRVGKIVAWRRGSVLEKGVMASSIILYTVFYPWFAILMLWLFASRFKWFPIGKFTTLNFDTRNPVINSISEWSANVAGVEPGAGWTTGPFTANEVFKVVLISSIVTLTLWGAARLGINQWVKSDKLKKRYSRILLPVTFLSFSAFWLTNTKVEWALDIAYHTFVPIFTLALVSFGGTALLTRTSMLGSLGEDYILTARAKGVPDKVVRDKHAARNALLPVVTSLVLALSGVIGGGIVTETIFSWPGVGLVLLNAVTGKDIPLAVGGLAMLAVLSLVAHLIADILYAFLDPRIRVQG